MTPTILEVQDLRLVHREGETLRPVVAGVSFQVEAGETVAIVGESGSGKTLSALACLRLLPEPAIQIERGRILFQGKDLLPMEREEIRKIRGNRIAMIFQDPLSSLNPYLSIERQMTEVLETHRGLSRAQAKDRCVEMLRRVGIPDPSQRIGRYPHQLSGGQRQRVLIAMALLCDPQLLLADEPTTALDVTVQAQILELLRELQKERGMAIVLITHDLGVVAGLAKRLYVMYAGRIAEEGRTEDIFARPRHPYTQGLLGSLPRPDVEGGRLAAIPGQPPSAAEFLRGCPFEPRCGMRTPPCRTELPPFQPISPSHSSACFEAYRL